MYFIFLFFFFNDTATTEIYTLSLHDALPISDRLTALSQKETIDDDIDPISSIVEEIVKRSEEHTSELQSQSNLVCRLLLEKKKKKKKKKKKNKKKKKKNKIRSKQIITNKCD